MLGSTKLISELLSVTIISIVPIVILFFLAERYFVTGSISTGLRG
jgi:ABC-type glycerol-3-phosphate transport system permease component